MPPVNPSFLGGGASPDQAQPTASLFSMLGNGEPVPPGMMSLNEYGELNPMMQWGGNQDALPASMNAADPYGGRTVRDVLMGGFGDMDANNNPVGGWQDATNWQNQPATHENISAGIARGGRYQPKFARSLFSSGPEGGWFAYPGAAGANESVVPWGTYNDPRKDPAPGLMGMSTNNWRLLPQGFQNPRFNMRSGHIINRFYEDKPWSFQTDKGADAPWGLGGPGHGFPVSHGSSNQRGYFFPGQLEPEIYEGGPGTT